MNRLIVAQDLETLKKKCLFPQPYTKHVYTTNLTDSFLYHNHV